MIPFCLSAKEAQKLIDPKLLTHPVHPCLWKIEGKNLTKPSYLFGTIHLSDKRVTTLHPKAQDAFEKSEVLYTEVDLSPAAQIKSAMDLMRKDGKKVSELIGPDATKNLNDYLASLQPGLSIAPFDSFHTWALFVTIPQIESQLSGKSPLDAVLQARATKAGKITDSLETNQDRIKIFSTLTEKEQTNLLKDLATFIKEEPKKFSEGLTKMLNEYLTKDPHAIGKLVVEEMNLAFADLEKGNYLTTKETIQKMMTGLLDTRNKKMSANIVKNLSSSPDTSHFFAVGAAHYSGKTAIQDLLKKEGYTITPAFK